MNSPRCLTTSRLVALLLALAAFAAPPVRAGELPNVLWTVVPDAPAAGATTAPSAKINPKLKLVAPSNTKITIVTGGPRPLLLAIAS